MESTTVKLYSLNYGNVRTTCSLVIHRWQHPFPNFSSHTARRNKLMPSFFTRIGAYKYGWKVGLLTAVLPHYQLLTFWYADAGGAACYFIKVRITAIAAGWAAQRFGRIHPGIGWRSTLPIKLWTLGRNGCT